MRGLSVVDSADPLTVLDGLRSALGGDGAAILPSRGAPEGLPARVEQRIALVVETSGSTGRPKRVALSADALLASAAASDSRLGGPGQWLLALPAHYIAGINVLVRSLASSTVPVVMSPDGFAAEGFVRAAADLDASRRFTSLVPAQLARLVAAARASDSSGPEVDRAADRERRDVLDTLRRFDRILVGGQAVTPRLLEACRDLGLAVTRTYGSSETAGGCVWDGIPIGDTDVRVIGGRVELSGSVLAERYLDDPERTAAAFHEVEGRRWYRTDDSGQVVDGALRIDGRLDDVIVSGGVKVSLAEVELVVRELPGLEDAVVVAAEHPEWGQAPVVVGTIAVDLGVVRDAVAARLGRPAAPARILLVEAIPHLGSGKPDRIALAGLVES